MADLFISIDWMPFLAPTIDSADLIFQVSGKMDQVLSNADPLTRFLSATLRGDGSRPGQWQSLSRVFKQSIREHLGP